MRDVNRIDEIVGRLRKVWHANPDLRLTQLIGNVFSYDPYGVEDEMMIDKVEKFYDPTKNPLD